MPPLRLNCTISEAGGVQICGVQADEMLSFEVNEYASGVCVGTFFEEEEFVCSLFTLSGDYSISIETADCIYIGYVSL